MKKEVYIKLSGKQKEVGNHEEQKDVESIESVARATYIEKDGTIYLFYNEDIQDGGTIDNKIVIYENKKIEIIKKGVITSHMEFKEGQVKKSTYYTPFSQILIGVDTKEVKIKKQKEELFVEIKYMMSVEGEVHSENTVNIFVSSN